MKNKELKEKIEVLSNSNDRLSRIVEGQKQELESKRKRMLYEIDTLKAEIRFLREDINSNTSRINGLKKEKEQLIEFKWKYMSFVSNRKIR